MLNKYSVQIHYLQIESMVVNLKRSFKSLMEEANWMEVSTKATANEKVI